MRLVGHALPYSLLAFAGPPRPSPSTLARRVPRGSSAPSTLNTTSPTRSPAFSAAPPAVSAMIVFVPSTLRPVPSTT